MRLYLSSFKLGNKPEELVSLVGENKKAVLILNALDHASRAREEFLISQTKELADLGFSVEELDLRKFFNKKDELEKFLAKKGLVWINGGNTFILRRAMKQSGFDIVIKKLLEKDALVYGGFSAAVCIITPTLRGLEITDDPNIAPDSYEKEIIWDGLNFIDYSVAVHYASDHSESHLTDKEIQFYEDNKMPYKKLRDGEVIIHNGNAVKMLE